MGRRRRAWRRDGSPGAHGGSRSGVRCGRSSPTSRSRRRFRPRRTTMFHRLLRTRWPDRPRMERVKFGCSCRCCWWRTRHGRASGRRSSSHSSTSNTRRRRSRSRRSPRAEASGGSVECLVPARGSQDAVVPHQWFGQAIERPVTVPTLRGHRLQSTRALRVVALTSGPGEHGRTRTITAMSECPADGGLAHQ